MSINTSDLSWFTNSNCVGNVSRIVHLYMKMQIFLNYVNIFNQTLTGLSRNKHNRKCLKLEHL